MRHGNRNNALSRTASHRSSMLSNMACSLIEHKRITTTLAKAKVLRKFVEPLITKSKTDSTHSRRLVFATLKSKDHVTELFRDVAPKVATREGGYTRIIKLGLRQGDAAEMCLIELVDFNELMLAEAQSTTRKSRRGGKKKSTDTTDAKATPAKGEKKDAKADDSKKVAKKEPKQELEAKEAAHKAKEEEVRAQELATDEQALEAKEKIPAKDPKSEKDTPDTDTKG